MESPQSRITKMEEFIRICYMRDVYNVLRPTVAQQEDENWWNDTFIQEAVNSNNFDFEDAWIDYEEDDDNQTNTPEVFVVIEMINKINKWSEEITGAFWDYDTLTYGKIFKNFAYFYVCSRGIDFWLEQKDMYNEYVAEMGDADDSDAESVEEEYNGSKDFPPNETDDNCPICLEAYTPQKQRDGIRNSEYKSRCPHYCCVPCWLDLYRNNEGEKKQCPICRANLTNWLEDNHTNHLGDYP